MGDGIIDYTGRASTSAPTRLQRTPSARSGSPSLHQTTWRSPFRTSG